MKVKSLLLTVVLLVTMVLTACNTTGGETSVSDSGSAGPQEVTGTTDSTEKIILGNIITMDEDMPRAEAVAVKDGIIVAVGTEEEARAAVSESAEVMDYTGQFVYPGFMDAHTHGTLAGYRSLGQMTIPMEAAIVEDKNTYTAELLKEYIEENPDKEYYLAHGWAEDEKNPIDCTFLDEICSDKPLMLNTTGGHSMLLNTKAMEEYGIDDAFAQQHGPELVRLNAEGKPNGYLCEGPAINLLKALPKTNEEMKEYILDWQNSAFSKGFTTVGDAGVELISDDALDAYRQLQDEGKLKLRTYGYLLAADNQPDPVGKVEEARRLADEINGEYFKIAGFKVFFDGVVEAHTAWLLDDYSDRAGYRGLERFNDPEILTQLLVESEKNDFAVLGHSIGDGATHFMLDCIEAAQEITGDDDQRNLITHLQLVSDEDKQRMADTNSIAGVPPLWVPLMPVTGDQEIVYVGEERVENSYPIKSFIDHGAKIFFHSDYPVSPNFDVPLSIYLAEQRCMPVEELGKLRGANERLGRQESLEALTTNVAYALHAEDILGSITPGKIANFTVVDTDFLECESEDLLDSEIIATIVDGDVVYKK